MTGYKRKILKRYYDYDNMKYSYTVWMQAVITDNIEKYNKRKVKKWQPLDGDLYDWYAFISDGIGEDYINIEKIYEWEVYADEQSGIL